VIAQEPAAGTKVARGSTVIVLLGPSCFPSNAPDSLRMVTTNGCGTDGSGYSSGGS
jgi:beta-lactam-binding protein with PASTA domain